MTDKEFDYLLSKLLDEDIRPAEVEQLLEGLKTRPERHVEVVDHLVIWDVWEQCLHPERSDVAFLESYQAGLQLNDDFVDKFKQRLLQWEAEHGSDDGHVRELPSIRREQADGCQSTGINAIKAFADEALEKFKKEESLQQKQLAYQAYRARQRRLIIGISSFAALLAILLLAWLAPPPQPESEPVVQQTPAEPPLVAEIVRSLDAVWDNNDVSTRTGTRLRAVPLNLEQGLVQIVFDDGAEVLLQAPCALKLEDAACMFLNNGMISAIVPDRAHGFKVQTTTGLITDYGTEFGVVARQSGETDTYVYKGSVGLESKASRSASQKPKVLKRHQAGTIEPSGRIKDKKFVPNQIIREIPGQPNFGIPGKRLDLADVVGGGNGFGTGYINSALDVITGQLHQDFYPEATGRGQSWVLQPQKDYPYTRVPELDYVDGVFAPISSTGIITVTSTGQQAAISATLLAGGFDTGVGNWCKETRHLEFGRITAVLGGVHYDFLDHPAIAMRRSKGVTFDLDAMRRDLQGIRIARFFAVCGLSEQAMEQNANFYVLVDGKVRFEQTDVTPMDGAIPIRFELHETDRFLTLTACYNPSDGWIKLALFAEPALELVPVIENTEEDYIN
jgi:hypothetical protein